MSNALSQHVWGKSAGADRVWAQVAGIGPRGAGRLIVVLQAFIDETYTKHGTEADSFVLAGGVATAEDWAALAKDWEALLPEHGQSENGPLFFHAADIRKDAPEHQVFWQVIDRHVPVLLSCRFGMSDYKRAQDRLYFPGHELERPGRDVSPYTVAFFCLMNAFHMHRGKMEAALPENERHRFPATEKVDFFFDDNPEHKTFFRDVWDNHMQRMRTDAERARYGMDPRFEDDKVFKPLQAADFWASWTRRWYDKGAPAGQRHAFVGAKSERKHLYVDLTYTEDELARLMSGMGEGTFADGHKETIRLSIKPKA